MFRAKTVFVIGAGASAELGFPLGPKLLQQIAEKVDISYEWGRQERGDHVLAKALGDILDTRTDVTKYNEHLKSAWQLVRSSKQGLSIDNVLDALEDPQASLVGKLGIVRCILAAEDESPLSTWNELSFDEADVAGFGDTWLGNFAKLLTENRRRSQIAALFENLTIINFNYDRTIEQFLPFAIAQYFGVGLAEVREYFSKVPLHRPYGKAGSLPWEDERQSVRFGYCRAHDIRVASDQILTFTEQIEDRQLTSAIRESVEEADRLVFLGFGFHRQNLELLAARAKPNVEVFGTSYGMSETDALVVRDEIELALGLRDNMVAVGHEYVKLYSLTCAEFLSEIWRSLTSEPGEDPTTNFPSLGA